MFDPWNRFDRYEFADIVRPSVDYELNGYIVSDTSAARRDLKIWKLRCKAAVQKLSELGIYHSEIANLLKVKESEVSSWLHPGARYDEQIAGVIKSG